MGATKHDLATAALEEADRMIRDHGIDNPAAVDAAWSLRHLADAIVHADQLRTVQA